MQIDPFDCHEDLCHLAWIIKHHRHLLTFLFFESKTDFGGFLVGPRCSNGTPFEELDVTEFDRCPLENLSIFCRFM